MNECNNDSSNAYDRVLPDGLADVLRVEVAVGTIGRTQQASVFVDRVVCNGQQRWRDTQTLVRNSYTQRSVTERTEKESEQGAALMKRAKYTSGTATWAT